MDGNQVGRGPFGTANKGTKSDAWSRGTMHGHPRAIQTYEAEGRDGAVGSETGTCPRNQVRPPSKHRESYLDDGVERFFGMGKAKTLDSRLKMSGMTDKGKKQKQIPRFARNDVMAVCKPICLRRRAGAVAPVASVVLAALGEFRHVHDPVGLFHVDETHPLRSASDVPERLDFGPEDFSFGRHDHDFIGFLDLMKGNGRSVSLVHLDTDYPAPRPPFVRYSVANVRFPNPFSVTVRIEASTCGWTMTIPIT